jgi:1,2-diacylglycerol 3-alpha-glucosyltransferase
MSAAPVESSPTQPLVSVVMPAFNREGTLRNAIDSVLRQDFDGLELVVVDDGSTDGTGDVARAVHDRRVHVVAQPNRGRAEARNRGVEAARGQFVVFLDSDDEAMADWLEVLVGPLRDGAALVRCAALVVDPDGHERVLPATASETPYPRGTPLPGTFALERNLFTKVGGFEPSLGYAENTELLIRVLEEVEAAARAVVVVDRPLVRIHRRSDRAAEYASAPAAAAAFILSAHPGTMRREPRERQNYLAIIATDELRSGRRWRAFQGFARSWVAWPRSGRAAVRLLRPVIGRAAHETPTATPRPDALRVAITCPGAGRVRRGYETFARELAAQLDLRAGVEVRLFQGARSDRPWAVRIPCLRRDGRAARRLARMLRLRPTTIEHYSFGLSSLVPLARFRPDVVVVSERVLAGAYGRIRRLPLLRFRLVLSNGGASGPPFARIDLVQHVTPVTFDQAIASGEPPARHVLVPYGFDLAPPATVSDIGETRVGLELPREGAIVLAVGSIDVSRKRMDHAIREVASMPRPPFLLMLGESSPETEWVAAMALASLGSGRFDLRSVEPEEMSRYYAIADALVLPSVVEGFGRVFIEASAMGLPCVAHDTPTTRYVLGDLGTFVDMTEPGALASALDGLLGSPDETAVDRRVAAASRFAWEAVLPDYLRMFDRVMVSAR